MTKITEGTLMPLSLVILALGGVFWLSSINSDAKATRADVEILRQKQDEYLGEIRRVDERLSRIEGKLGIHLDH